MSSSDMSSSDMNSPSELPNSYDGTQLLIRCCLPQRPWTIAEVYESAYGIRLDDGAKPWPYYRDSQTGEWWAMGSSTTESLDRLVWMIPLDQLRHKARRDADDFLESVFFELQDAAEGIGGVAEPECSVADALAKMDRVSELLAVRDCRITILVRAPGAGDFCDARSGDNTNHETSGRAAYTVDEWWDACDKVGLTYGDGNLFWAMNDSRSRRIMEPDEYFCVEPHSQPGYFHPSDRDTQVAFPDVALSFRVRDFHEPHNVLDRMVEVARGLADVLGATVMTEQGAELDVQSLKRRLDRAIEKLRALEA